MFRRPLAPPLILLVDDDPFQAEVASYIAYELGCDFDSALSGTEALEKVDAATARRRPPRRADARPLRATRSAAGSRPLPRDRGHAGHLRDGADRGGRPPAGLRGARERLRHEALLGARAEGAREERAPHQGASSTRSRPAPRSSSCSRRSPAKLERGRRHGRGLRRRGSSSRSSTGSPSVVRRRRRDAPPPPPGPRRAARGRLHAPGRAARLRRTSRRSRLEEDPRIERAPAAPGRVRDAPRTGPSPRLPLFGGPRAPRHAPPPPPRARFRRRASRPSSSTSSPSRRTSAARSTVVQRSSTSCGRRPRASRGAGAYQAPFFWRLTTLRRRSPFFRDESRSTKSRWSRWSISWQKARARRSRPSSVRFSPVLVERLDGHPLGPLDRSRRGREGRGIPPRRGSIPCASTTTGLTRTRTCDGSFPTERSTIATRRLTPICGAASPRPGRRPAGLLQVLDQRGESRVVEDRRRSRSARRGADPRT